MGRPECFKTQRPGYAVVLPQNYQKLSVVVNYLSEQLKIISSKRRHFSGSTFLVPAAALFLCWATARAAVRPLKAKRYSAAQKQSPESPDQIELNRRIKAADAAQLSGNPQAIEREDKRLIAEGLRIMGKLRLAESAFSQSAQLFRSSLALENAPGLHADVAIALQLAGQQGEAIAEAQKAIAEAPSDPKPYITLGRAYLAKGEFDQAATAFAHATRIHPDVDVLYSLALSWLSSKDPDARQRADAVFAEMKAMAGDSGSLHVLMGRAYRDTGLMPDAIKQFKRAIELDTTTPHAHYFLGLAYLSQNEWQPTPQAQAEIEKEVQYHPKDFLANYMLGFVASSEHQYAEADKYLKIAAGLNPTWPEPFLYMGLDAFAQGDDKTAETMLRKADDLTGSDESRANYQIRRAYVDLARILAREGKEKESDVFVVKARNLENKVMQDSQQRTTALMMSKGGKVGSMAAIVPLDNKENHAASLANASADAAERLDAATIAKSNLTSSQQDVAKTEEDAMRPVLGQAYSGLATAEAMQHDYATALTNYEAAEQWDPSVSDLEKNLGQAAFLAEKYPEAIHGLSQAVKENPNANALRAMLGMAYFEMKRYGDAATTFYPLGEAGMSDPKVGYAWAASLAEAGDLKHASEVLTRYQEEPLTNEGRMLVGRLWIQIGDYDRAIDTFKKILASDPAFPRVHYAIALADIRAERWNDARAELASSPEDADAMYDLGFVDLQQSQNDDARKMFEQVIAKHPDYANAQYQLGKLLMDSGKTEEAVPHLEAAAKLEPNKDYVHYQLQAAYRKAGRTADADRELAVYQQIKDKARAQLKEQLSQKLEQKP
jgi:tetratricopeptide (TPR) repeat protein